MDPSTIWEQALTLFDERRGQLYAGTLRSAKPRSFDGSIFTIAVPNTAVANMLQKRDAVCDCIRDAADCAQLTVEYVVDSSLQKALESVSVQPESRVSMIGQSARDSQQQISAALNDQLTMQSFMVADFNRFAHSAAQQVIDNPGRCYNPLFIYAPAGLGKTHLMQAIAHELSTQKRLSNLVYEPAENFMNGLIEAIRENRTSEFRRQHRNADLWLVDDIQFLRDNDAPASEEEFFHTLNALVIKNKQVVVASDVPPKQLKIANDRLRSRLEMGILADMHRPDVDMRKAMFRWKLEQDYPDMTKLVSEEVIDQLGKRVEPNIRTMEGTLKGVLARIRLSGKIAQAELDDLLSQHTQAEDTRHISLEEILNYVVERMNCSAADLVGPKRSKEISWARQLAMYLARELTDYSLADIGGYLGKRESSTVLWGYNKVSDLVTKDQSIAWLVSDMKAAIRG